MDSLNLSADEPSPERVVAARAELEEVLRLMSRLPARCRQVLELRKIQGLSQREIAARLGITEAVVENDVAKGLRLISKALRDRPASTSPDRPQRVHDRVRIRRPD
jgi:RNA polymerase sigma-70 factor (ECF subfamily)